MMPVIRNAFSDDAVEAKSPAVKHGLESSEPVTTEEGIDANGSPKRQRVETSKGDIAVKKSTDGKVIDTNHGTSSGEGSSPDTHKDGQANEDEKVDPTQLASAFALASLAALGPGNGDQAAGNGTSSPVQLPKQGDHRSSSDDVRAESRDVTQNEKSNDGRDDAADTKVGGVQNMASWDETRSPKADQHPISPEEQRSPGLGGSNLSALLVPTQEDSVEGEKAQPMDVSSVEKAGEEDSPAQDEEGGDDRSRKVTFHPNTKETSAPPSSTSVGRARLAAAASRRMAKAKSAAEAAAVAASSQQNGDNGTDDKDSSSMVVSPRPHRPAVSTAAGLGGGSSPFTRTPPRMPPHATPPMPPPHLHHPFPAYHHGGPGMPPPPHVSPYHPTPPPPPSHLGQMHSPFAHGPPPGHHISPAYHHYSPLPHHPHHGGPPPPPHAHMHSPWGHSPGPHGYHGGPEPASPHLRGGPGYPRHLMQPPLAHSPSGGMASSAAPPPQPHPWICDHCNIASFATYEEAVRHEGICAHNPSVTRRRPGTTTKGAATNHPDMSSVAHSLLSMSRSRSDVSTGVAADINTMGQLNASTKLWYEGSMKLSVEDSDREWLSEMNCFIREHCIEAFSATDDDISESTNRGRVVLKQVGLRCVYCKNHKSHNGESSNCNPAKGTSDDEAMDSDPHSGNDCEDSMDNIERTNAAMSFPTTLSGIYESVKRWHKVHVPVCTHIPVDVRAQLNSLATSNDSVPAARQYWSDSARALGLVDTSMGIRFSRDPKSIRDEVRKIARLPSGEEPEPGNRHTGGMYRMNRMDHLHAAVMATSSPPTPTRSPVKKRKSPQESPETQQPRLQHAPFPPGGYLVHPEDIEMIPPYVYFLMRQVEPCLFTEADRFVARSKGPVGYPGFQCRHCNGHAGLGKYFPVSSKSLSTNSTSQNIHAHLLKCRKCPASAKDQLVKLKIEKSRQPRLEPGWRKVFFDKVWARLHYGENGGIFGVDKSGSAPTSQATMD